jgi:hypothetical protein
MKSIGGPLQHDVGTSNSIRNGEYIDQLSNYQLLRKDFAE